MVQMGEIMLYYRATTKSEYGKKKWKFIDKDQWIEHYSFIIHSSNGGYLVCSSFWLFRIEQQ